MARKILVVDDDLRMVKLLTSRLKGSGYEVATAYDGQQCVKIARAASSPSLDVILSPPGRAKNLRAFRTGSAW